MKRAIPMILLVAACALQWALPGALALRGELTLRSGQRYYLRTAPVDPLDAFRGRYVALRFSGAQAAVAAGDDLHDGDRVYVPIRTGADRYAVFGTASRTPPADGDYLEAHVLRSASSPNAVELQLPFDRYYLDERAAPAAERAYREANRGGAAADAYVSIRVRDGHAALEELFIDNVPVRQRLAGTPAP